MTEQNHSGAVPENASGVGVWHPAASDAIPRPTRPARDPDRIERRHCAKLGDDRDENRQCARSSSFLDKCTLLSHPSPLACSSVALATTVMLYMLGSLNFCRCIRPQARTRSRMDNVQIAQPRDEVAKRHHDPWLRATARGVQQQRKVEMAPV